MLDCSKELPKGVELYGIDLSDKNFATKYPPYVYYRNASVTRLPSEWSNYFDVVNQRLLIAGLLAADWPIALSEIFRVLKPNGQVQFVEVDCAELANSSPQQKRWMSLYKQLYSKSNHLWDCAARLPSKLKQAGFTNIVSEKKHLPVGKAWGEIGEIGAFTTSGARRGMKSTFVREGILTSDEFELIFDDMLKEFNGPAKVVQPFRIVTARKPGRLEARL